MVNMYRFFVLLSMLLLLFHPVECTAQLTDSNDPSLFHFGSAQQMMHGTFKGYDYTESCGPNTRVTSIKFKDYIYVAWTGVIGSLNIACLGSTHQKELLKADGAIPNTYHGYQDTLGGFAYATGSPTMVVYDDKLYIFYNHSANNQIKYLTIAQEGTVTIAERGDLVGSPAGLVNITAYPSPEYDGILFVGRVSDDSHIRLYLVGKRDVVKTSTLQPLIDQTFSEQCLGSISLCEVTGGRRMIAWTGTDFHLNTAFLEVSSYQGGTTIQQKYTHTDHSSHSDGPLLFRKENADDNDVHILWRGWGDDTKLYQGVINAGNKNTFQQFSIDSANIVSNFTPTLISLNEMITYMFWPAATASDPYNVSFNVMMAKALDYTYQDWMGSLMKDYHTLKNMVLPGSHNAGMNDVTQVTAFPALYKALEMPDFGGCNECGFVTQVTGVKEQMEMGYRYFGINLTNAQYSLDWTHTPPYFDDKNKLHTSVQPIDHVNSTCLGEGFENMLTVARDFLSKHPKEFIVINIKDLIGSATSFSSLLDDLNATLPVYKDVIYQKTHAKTFADLVDQPIGTFRGKIILTVADTVLANTYNLIRDVFETSHDNRYRYINPTNTRTDKLVDNQNSFFNNPAYTGSYKRIDWQTNLTWSKVLCDLRPFNECMEKPRPGLWHHIMHIANCAGEVLEMGTTIAKAFVEPEDPRNIAKIIGWIASAFGQTSLATVQNNNKFLYPTVYDMVRNKVIRQNNMVNIVYTEAADYLYTDLCMQLLTDFNEYDEVSIYNSQIAVTDTHLSVSCRQPNAGVATVTVKGGYAPYKYHWSSNDDTTATTAGLSEGYHKVRITDAMNHSVTHRVYVSFDPHAHSGLANRHLSKTEVQPYGLSNYYETDCDNLIARVESEYTSTGISDTLTASVWIDDLPNRVYVKRHYQLIPSHNAASASARVTLYFTQKEFDEFNLTNPAFRLPRNGQDSAAIRNVMIWQKPGVTSDNSGGMLTYPTTTKEIFPKQSDVIWNGIVNRWEVSFQTEGFGAYFLTTHDGRETDEWLTAYASFRNGKPEVEWQVNEKEASRYYVEYSFDQRNFSLAGVVNSQGRGTHRYTFLHQNRWGSPGQADSAKVVFYRVRQIFNNRPSTVSELIPLSPLPDQNLYVYPNPFADNLVIYSTLEMEAFVLDLTGRLHVMLRLQKGQNVISTSSLPTGFYFVRTAKGESYKIIKAQ